MTAFLAGLMLGAAGSGHCAVMCGPLVLTFGPRLKAPSRAARLRHSLIYHAGRILTYLALAVPAGFIGQTVVLRGFGRALTIAAGLVLLTSACGWLRPRLTGRAGAIYGGAATRLCVAAARFNSSHTFAGPLMTGAANGLVPCGLVYAAVTAAAAMGTTTDAVVLMLGFGVGTIPVLVTLSVSALSLQPVLRGRLRKLAPIALALTAALLLVRGMASPTTAHQHADSPAAIAHH